MSSCKCGADADFSLDCCCELCKGCALTHVREKLFLAARRASPILIPCPNKCREPLCLDLVKQIASLDEELDRYLSSVLATIPDHRPTEFAAFHYEIGSDGKLKNRDSGEGFHFINQAHYDALGDLIVPHIQHLMKMDFGFEEVLIPTDAEADEGRGNIFLSPDFHTNTDTLLLIIQGSGAVRAGQWARALCINDSLDTGSILPYLQKAREHGWSSVVFNPNQWVDDRELPDDPDFDPAVFLTTKKVDGMKVRRKPIRGSENAPAHCSYVWETIAKQSPAANVLIVAHSAGGPCTLSLLRTSPKSLLPRLRGVAFTDSVHYMGPSEKKHVVDFISKHAVNYVTSSEPLDTLVEERTSKRCRRVSAGHTKHEHTSAAAISSVFPFLAAKLEENRDK